MSSRRAHVSQFRYRRKRLRSDAGPSFCLLPAACSRSASTRSRIASATSSFDASGTWCSPARSTIVTSLLVESKPISGRETSLKTIASTALRSSFARARSIERAGLGGEADQRLVRRGASRRRRRGCPRSARAAARARRRPRARSCLGRGRGGAEVGRRGGHQQHVGGRRTRLSTASASSAVVSTAIVAHARRRRQRDVGGDQRHLGARAAPPPRPAPAPSGRSSGCR